MQHQNNKGNVKEPREEPEGVPLDKLGWYTGEEMPKHVSDSDTQEEAYHALAKQVKSEDWPFMSTSLKDKIAYLCCNELFSDVIISLKLQDKHYPAHRFILALQSDYFQKLFYGSFHQDRYHKVHQVEKVSPVTMEKILRHFYGESEVLISYEESEPSLKDFDELSKFADMYLLDQLHKTCEQYALKILDNEKVCYQYACQLFETACLLNMYDLHKKCLELFIKKSELFLNSPHFVMLNGGVVKALYDFAVHANKIKVFTPFLKEWCRSELKRSNRPDSDLADLMGEFLILVRPTKPKS